MPCLPCLQWSWQLLPYNYFLTEVVTTSVHLTMSWKISGKISMRVRFEWVTFMSYSYWLLQIYWFFTVFWQEARWFSWYLLRWFFRWIESRPCSRGQWSRTRQICRTPQKIPGPPFVAGMWMWALHWLTGGPIKSLQFCLEFWLEEPLEIPFWF